MANRTPSQVTQDILAKLAVTIPDMSVEIGTPQRKFIEVLAEAIAETEVDGALVQGQDIDSKAGVDLDNFVGSFAYGRLQGGRATGTIVITLSTPAIQPVVIPVGTQFTQPLAGSSVSLSFNSTVQATVAKNSVSVSIPVQCTVIGSSGNVAAGTVTRAPAGIGIYAVTNPAPFSGGFDSETDEALRDRFKKTFLRNIAGTSDFYTAIPLQVKNVSRVNVIGPVSTYETQVQAVAPGNNVLPANNCKYVWPRSMSVGRYKGTSSEEWFTEGTHYNYSGGAYTSPTLTTIGATLSGQFLDISYEYTSSKSRNDPVNGKTNKIDIYVDGTNVVKAVTEKLIIRSITLVSDTTSDYFTGNLIGATEATALTTSSKFQRLGSTPIAAWPSTLVMVGYAAATLGGANNPFILGTHYFGVRDATVRAGSERDIAGIVWKVTPPADDVAFTATYDYNQTPQVVNAIFRKAKQLTTDVLVHEAVPAILDLRFIVQYNNAVSISNVNTNIVTALQAYLTKLPFGSWIQLSDITQVVHNVSGVDNVRFAKTADGTDPYGNALFPVRSRRWANGTPVTQTGDFQLDTDAVASLALPTRVIETVPTVDLSMMFIRRSFNNFGS